MPNSDVIMAVLSIIAGAISAYVGVRVGLVKLETQMSTALKELSSVSSKAAIYGEDLLIHDMEIGAVMQKLDMDRVIRQRVRDG